MKIKVERKNQGVETLMILDRSWGSFDDERGLASEDFVMCYEVHMTAVTPNGRELEYKRVGDKVVIDKR